MLSSLFRFQILPITASCLDMLIELEILDVRLPKSFDSVTTSISANAGRPNATIVQGIPNIINCAGKRG
jgi:hypothetical protein